MLYRSFLNSRGAGEEIRTPDLRITNALLYQLSYTGAICLFTLAQEAVFCLHAATIPSSEQAPVMG